MTLIACVEDDEKIAANLVLRLREAGHGVVRFASGEEAFRWLRDGNPQPDMLLVDVRLPAMSGIDLLGVLGAGRLVKINCAAIPTHLIEDELFGHARGAFTDAKSAKAGLFEQADGGTLLLDEIGDMDLALQSRLLRVIEDGRVRRVGETAERAVDVRVIAATHRDLEALVRAGAFRQDLYFRLAAVPIDVPPLRERADDVPLLFTAFLEQFCRRNGRMPLTVDADVFARLRAYRWPGNVRELRNVAEQMSVFATDPVTAEQLPSAITAEETSEEIGVLRLTESARVLPLAAFKAQCEKEYIEMVLQRTNCNVSRAAELLDVQRTHLHQKISSLGLRRPAKTPS